MLNAFIVDGIRTAIGKFTGSLSPVRADDLAAHVLKDLLRRSQDLDPERIGDVVLGCANQAGEDNRNVARMALLLAGLPQEVPGETVNRLCASGMSSALHAARTVHLGEAEFVIAGGVEQMTRAPFVMAKNARPFGREAELYDTTMGWRFVNPQLHEQYGSDGMGVTAENLAEQYKISREDQDVFAAWSHRKAYAAQVDGRLAEEIVALNIPRRKQDDLVFAQDEFIRPDTTIEVLAKLRPAFKKDGSVTAGNSSGINDGACALLLGSDSAVQSLGKEPIAQVIASGVVGVEPRIMGIGPVGATKQALKRASLTLDDMDVIELNEAFAVQCLACMRELGLEDSDPRINPNGGAIALGHPLGMSGARLLLTAARELQRRKGTYALCTMCVGVGQGMACILKRV